MTADLPALVARPREAAAVDELLAQPPVSRTATPGEAAELRHLLYDADPDATIPAFPYPTAAHQETL